MCYFGMKTFQRHLTGISIAVTVNRWTSRSRFPLRGFTQRQESEWFEKRKRSSRPRIKEGKKVKEENEEKTADRIGCVWSAALLFIRLI